MPSIFDIPGVDLPQALAGGANPNQATGTGLTALHKFQDDPQAVAALLSHGADPTLKTYLLLQTPLHMATDAEVALLLIHAGASVHEIDGMGRTPLHVVLDERRDLDVARAFLAHGASPNAGDYNGLRPLHLARSIEAADLLIDAGADMEARDRNGFEVYNSYARPFEVNLHISMRLAAQQAEDERQLLDANTALIHGGPSQRDRSLRL